MSAPDVAGLPWPEGDVGGLRGAARASDQIGRGLQVGGNSLVGLRSPGTWEGQAAGAYSQAVQRQSRMMTRAAGDLEGVGGALQKLAATIEDAQERVRELARRVVDAEARARDAELKAQEAAAIAVVATGAAEVANAVNLDVGLESAAENARAASNSATSAAQGLQSEAGQVRERATTEAEELCQQVKRLDSATASEISGATVLMGGTHSASVAPPTSKLASHVIPAFAPILAMDGNEENLPGSFEESLRNAVLRTDDDGNLYLDLDGTRSGVPASTKLYVDLTTTGDGRLQIHYWRWHPYNDFPAPVTNAGDHEGDWERVVVQFDRSGQPAYVGYDAHGHMSAREWADAERAGNRPIVYVSHGGHASYPESGEYDGPSPADDEADGQGVWIAPDQNHVVDARANPYFYAPDRHGASTTGSFASPRPPGNQRNIEDLATVDGIEPRGRSVSIGEDLDDIGESADIVWDAIPKPW